MEEKKIDFMGYKAMCHCRPMIQREHNMRNPKIVKSEKHIDLSRLHETILDMGTINECYEKIFGEAIVNYNAKQKRKDRRITNYLEQIIKDKRQGKHKNLKADGSRKPAYEMIIQLGNRDNRPDDEKATKVLKSFCYYITEKYPNIVPIGIYLHNDEFSIDEETGKRVYSPVHIHFDFVYTAHLGKSLKTGMELQSSMSGALAEMGFVTSKGKGTAQAQFEEACRHDLQDFAEEWGMIIDRTPGEKHSHKQKSVYQQMKENQKKEKRLERKAEELSEREKFVEAGEAPLIKIKNKLEQKDSILNQKEKMINEKEKIADKKTQEALSIQEKNEHISKNLETKQNDLEHDKNMFATSKKKVEVYNQICTEVQNNNMTIDSEVENMLNNRSVDFSSRLNKFVSNVKKIFTAIITELNWYKAAFKNFWKNRAQDFRKLADIMDRNHCENFSDYNQKFHNGLLDYQIQEKKKIQEEHSQNQIDNDWDYDR